MRSKLVKSVFIITFILIAGCSKAPLSPDGNDDTANEHLGTMRVTAVDDRGVRLDGASVYLNGEFEGLSPVQIDSIEYGLHTLRVQKEGFQLHSENVVIENSLMINKEVVIHPVPLNTGQLFVTVNQDSALITVKDGAERVVDQRKSRDLQLTLEAGGYFVRCEKPGYGLVLKAVQVRADTVTVQNIELSRIAEATLPQIVLSLPDSAIAGTPVLFSWESENAQNVSVDYIEQAGLSGKWAVVFDLPGMRIVNAVARNDAGQASVRDSVVIYELPDVPPTIELSVSPQQIYTDDVCTISWKSDNAATVAVDYVPNAGLSGKWQERFSHSGTVVINASAYGPGGEVSVSTELEVLERQVMPPSIDVTIEEDVVVKGEKVLLTWTSENATSVDVDFVRNPGLSGRREIQFDRTGQIIVNAYAYGDGGSASAADTVVVREADVPAPRVSVTVTPDRVVVGGDVTISWESANANRVDVDYVSDAGTSGRRMTRFASAGTYVIGARAYGDGGEARSSDTLHVLEATPPSVQLSASPKEVAFGTPVTLTWQSDGHHVMIDHGVGMRGPVGSEEVSFINPGVKVFTVVAYGDHDLTTTATDSVRILEPEQPELPVITLSVIDSVEVGQPAAVEWHSWNATAVDVDYVSGAGLNGKSELLFSTPGERLITATAYNDAGQVTEEELLVVVFTPVAPQVETILVPSGAKVSAIHDSNIQYVENAGTAEIEVPGYYRVIAAAWYNSGDDQKNESFYITIDGETPMDPNAGEYKVVPDDPGPPHVSERDAGLFYLDAGVHMFSMYHYYLISAQYPQFMVGNKMKDAESVQILYFKLEYVKAGDALAAN
jgi:hypothetical protein